LHLPVQIGSSTREKPGMNVLVLGGTQFVGRHIVEELLRGGHAVTVFNRGQTIDELPPQVERLRGDRSLGIAGLGALSGRKWEACIDVSGWMPSSVRSSTEKLCSSVRHYAFISAVSVYGDPACGPVRESHPRSRPVENDVNEIDQSTYGPLKVACENIVSEVFGDRCTLLRPQIVAGPYDPEDRFSYWVRRATQGGEMLAPGRGADHMQVIDARDLACFVRTVCEKRVSGRFNLAGPRLTWTQFMSVLGASNLVWVPAEIISAAGVTEYELPLFRPAGGPRSSLMHVDNSCAVDAGLTLTDPAMTVRDVRTWLFNRDRPPALSSELEDQLIRRSRNC
jgi:2'-hydroxyisoflavone reductase